MCQTLFPALMDLPTDRIQLYLEYDGEQGLEYVQVADQVWPSFLHKPPKHIRVVVPESAEEAQQRTNSEALAQPESESMSSLPATAVLSKEAVVRIHSEARLSHFIGMLLGALILYGMAKLFDTRCTCTYV